MILGSETSDGQDGLPPIPRLGPSSDEPERSLRERFVRTRPVPPPTDVEALMVRIAAVPTSLASKRSPRPPTKGTVIMPTAAALAVVAGLVFLASSFQPTPIAAMTILQEAQEALEKTGSVSFEISAFEDGKRRNRAPARIRVLAPGHLRIDEPDGNYSVTDLKTGKSLRVVPAARRAQLIERTAVPGKAGLLDIYEFFRHIDRKKTGDLPPRMIGKIEAIGFEAVVGDPFGKGNTAVQFIRVWVHPKTKLPLRLEHEPKAVHSYGMRSMPTAVCENFVFDEPLEPELFSLKPPKGYEIAP